MRSIATLFLSALLVSSSAGCGGDMSTDGGTVDSGAGDTGTVDSGSGDSGTPDTGTSDSGGGDAGVMDGATDGGGGDAATDGGGGDAATDGGGGDAATDGGDAGASAVVVAEVMAAAWANCMPIVPADPLRFVLELRYDNTAGTTGATAQITSATVTFDDPAATTTDVDFDVEIVSIGAGAIVTQSHRKTTSTPIVPSCSVCSGGRTMTYDLVIDVDGVNVPVSGTTSFICTF